MTPDESYEQFNPRREIAQLRAALRRFVDIAETFVERVDNGEVHSVRTYREMKEALDGARAVKL